MPTSGVQLPIYVGEIKGKIPMQDGTKQAFNTYGIGLVDVVYMLEADPLSMSDESGVTASSDSKFDYTVAVNLSGSLNFFDLFKTTFKTDDSMTWSNSNSGAFSNSTSTSAAVTLIGPSPNYTGLPAMAVYYDTIFKDVRVRADDRALIAVGLI